MSAQSAASAKVAYFQSREINHIKTCKLHVVQARKRLADKDERLRLAIASARKAGLSWHEIGDAMGISKQAAQQYSRNSP